MTALASFFARAFHAVMSAIGAQGVLPAGPPLGCYLGMPTDTVDVAAGFPVGRPITAVGDVTPMQLPGGRAVTTVHVGPFDTLTQTYAELAAWMAAQGLQPAEMMWEVYLSDPQNQPDPATWRTQIMWPVA